ncbi:MAG: hypothetical protein M3O46_21315 [Myxococcota bacterium]|nr:hypothetical protein [Myxococcota bacterium]
MRLRNGEAGAPGWAAVGPAVAAPKNEDRRGGVTACGIGIEVTAGGTVTREPVMAALEDSGAGGGLLGSLGIAAASLASSFNSCRV